MLLQIVSSLLAFVSAAMEDTLFNKCDVDLAMELEVVEPIDIALKYFLLKRFKNEKENALLHLVSASVQDHLISILIGRVASSDNLIQIDQNNTLNILFKACEKISEEYKKNRFNFKEIRLLSTSETKEVYDVLTNIWSLDNKIIQRFYSYLDTGALETENVLKELKFLAKNNNPRAFGSLGCIYYYGLGVNIDKDKAMEYFIKGKKYYDPTSLIGLAKIYSEAGVNELQKAKKCLEKAIKINGSPEAYYDLYTIKLKESLPVPTEPRIIIDGSTFKSVNVDNVASLLQNSAVGGYLPAVFEFAVNSMETYPAKQILQALMSISQYDLQLYHYSQLAFNAYSKGEFKKAAIYYLFLTEFKLKNALLNAVFILENHRVFERQDCLLFQLYTEAAVINKNFNKNIGDCYFYGIGVEQSYAEAFSYYLISFKYSEESAYNLAYMHENGLGVDKDLKIAYKYINECLRSKKTYLVSIYAKIRIICKMMATPLLIAFSTLVALMATAIVKYTI